jgi:glycerophosphoryl diester phosphodiesterase
MSGFSVPGRVASRRLNPTLISPVGPRKGLTRNSAASADGMVSGMLVLAHRGANRVAPENTVPAMREAVARGADGVELDVHGTADGALVVRHDADTPAGPLGELTLADVRRELPDVPTLAEVLDVCRGRLVNVEVKDTDPRAAEALVDLLATRRRALGDPPDDVPDDVLVSSFDLAVVDHVRDLDPDVPTGFLSFGLDPHSALVLAAEHGHAAVHPDVWTLANVDVAAFATRAHDLGRQVNVWTVNDAAQVELLRDAGVDGVITDDTELYVYGSAGSA